MDETKRPGQSVAPGLLNDYCQIFNWQFTSASTQSVSKNVSGVLVYLTKAYGRK